MSVSGPPALFPGKSAILTVARNGKSDREGEKILRVWKGASRRSGMCFRGLRSRGRGK
jgi:hypothetical protein